MNKINLNEIYKLSYLLHPLTAWKDETTKVSLLLATWEIRTHLNSLIHGKPVKLRNTEAVNTLVSAINNAISEDKSKDAAQGWANTKVDKYVVRKIATLASNLEIILTNEFPLIHGYLISEKGILSIDALINNPEGIFSESMIQNLQALEGKPLDDFREAARCLAFGFATACGFHIVRSAEAVLRKWHQLINSTADFKTEWAPCVEKIRAENKSEQNQELKRQIDSLLDVLTQIKDTHRNPLMHPEISLNQSEAEILFNLTTSAIYSMMIQICRVESLTQ